MTTTTNSGLGEHTDGDQPNTVRRWIFSVIAILFAGAAGYLFAYTIGIAAGGSASASWTVLRLLGGTALAALCVAFMRLASQQAPKAIEHN